MTFCQCRAPAAKPPVVVENFVRNPFSMASKHHATTLLSLSDLRRNGRRTNYRLIREHCANAFLGDQTALCRVLGRYKMQVDTGDIGLSSHLLLDGAWEMWVVEFLLDRVKPGMIAVDAGANLGYFTLLMGDLVGGTGHVHAFEPNPAIATRLRASVAINGFDDRTTVHQIGLSDRAGEAALAIPAGEPKNGHVIGDIGRPGSVPIALDRLDAISAIPRVDFMKVDVEGSEELLWTGMQGVLDQGRSLTVLLEFTAARYADAAAFLSRMIAHGFSLEHLTLARGVQPITPAELLALTSSEDQMIVLTR